MRNSLTIGDIVMVTCNTKGCTCHASGEPVFGVVTQPQSNGAMVQIGLFFPEFYNDGRLEKVGHVD